MPFGDGLELTFRNTTALPLARCPHCAVANPSLLRKVEVETAPARSPMSGVASSLHWHVFVCQTCGGLVAGALAKEKGQYLPSPIAPIYHWLIPSPAAVASSLPPRVAHYLGQARETLTSPSASVVMAASAVDAMLKAQGYKDGSLYARIEAAAQDGLITKAMAAVAHDVRLDANAERHVDDAAPAPTDQDAQRCFDFAEALAELMFVLPARVKRAKPAGTA